MQFVENRQINFRTKYSNFAVDSIAVVGKKTRQCQIYTRRASGLLVRHPSLFDEARPLELAVEPANVAAHDRLHDDPSYVVVYVDQHIKNNQQPN